jgi:hypothetical protein
LNPQTGETEQHNKENHQKDADNGSDNQQSFGRKAEKIIREQGIGHNKLRLSVEHACRSEERRRKVRIEHAG